MKGEHLRIAWFLALSMTWPALGRMQTPPPPPPRVTAVVSVTGIDLDASATKDGQPVIDLRPEEMTLEIDGRRTALDYFSPVVTGRLTAPARGSGADEAGDVARHFLLLIDEDHVEVGERRRAFAAARALVASLEGSDRLSVVVMERGLLRAAAPFGTPVQDIAAAIDRQESRAPLAPLYREEILAERWHRERNAWQVLARAVRSLGAYPGRRELILVSRGLDDFARVQGYASLVSEVADLERQANRSRVTVHTIGAAGLDAVAGFT